MHGLGTRLAMPGMEAKGDLQHWIMVRLFQLRYQHPKTSKPVHEQSMNKALHPVRKLNRKCFHFVHQVRTAFGSTQTQSTMLAHANVESICNLQYLQGYSNTYLSANVTTWNSYSSLQTTVKYLLQKDLHGRGCLWRLVIDMVTCEEPRQTTE